MGSVNPVILSCDCITPLGLDFEAQWQAALAGRSGIGPLTRFPLDDDFPVRIAGQVPELDHLAGRYDFLAPRHRAAWSSPVFAYGLLSVVRALARAGIEITPELAPRVGVT